MPGAGVFGDIGESFLNDPVEGKGNVLGEGVGEPRLKSTMVPSPAGESGAFRLMAFSRPRSSRIDG